MIDLFNDLWDQARPAFCQQKTHERARRLAMSVLLCLGRRTITGLISAGGRHRVDWSADFRLFEQERFNQEALFGVSRKTVLRQLSPDDHFVVLMDDTLLRKRGKKMAGTSWRRDPLGPPFHINFIWGQRFLQLSAVVPENKGACRARAIPIDLQHCPSPQKPSRKADPKDWELYRTLLKESNITKKGVQRLQVLRKQMDELEHERSRTLIACVDGAYTNRTVLKSMPSRTTLIGRIRKDAKLYDIPGECTQGPGRKRVYGQRLHTPEQLRQDECIPWKSVPVYASGRIHQMDFKTMGPVRWRTAGKDHDLLVIAIRPLSYRLSKHSPLLYRKPVYLVCTDTTLPLELILQYYVWRWEIECNFRDEKTLLGMEQAQVRTPQAVACLPVFISAVYSFLLLAASQMPSPDESFQKFSPKWRKHDSSLRVTTPQLISLFRKQLWGLGIQNLNFSGFLNQHTSLTTRQKLQNSLHNAVFFAHG